MASDPLDILLYLANQQARIELGIPGMFARVGDRIVLTENFANHVGYRTQIALTEIVADAAAAAGQGVSENFRDLATAIKRDLDDGGGRHLLEAHQKLAKEMHEALIAGYKSSMRGRRVPPYRRKNRLSGRLGPALQNPDMVKATPKGIDYINQNRLNMEAAHWARLNFGVKPAPTDPPAKVSLRIFGENVGTVGLSARPRPPMFLPAGFWMSPGGEPSAPGERDLGQRSRRTKWRRQGSGSTQAFFPTNGPAEYPTKGIVGSNFMDAGFRALEANVDRVYLEMMRDIVANAEDAARRSVKRRTIKRKPRF